jgi:pimeloyl-ACP methyl ester carboxylesterase
LFSDPVYFSALGAEFEQMFTYGNEGYADDRIADGPGWVTFDVSAITCPVIVLHGDRDVILPVAQARFTTKLVPHAELRVYEGLGHFSIIDAVVPAVRDVAGYAARP